MCINEAVKRLNSLSLINDRCLELQKKKTSKFQYVKFVKKNEISFQRFVGPHQLENLQESLSCQEKVKTGDVKL